MKKLLIGTSLIAGVMAAGVASAQQTTTKAPFTLSLGGELRYTMGLYNDNTARDGHLENGMDARVTIEAAAKAENGLEYGFVGRFRNTGTDGTMMDRKYIYLSGSWGKVNLGDNDGAATLLEITAPDAGFIQSDTYYAGANSLTDFGLYDFFFADEGTFGTKITYLTPVFSGFQAGISYTPDYLENNNTGGGRNLIRNNVNYEDMWEIGAGYNGTLGPVTLALGAGYIMADRVDNSLGKYRVWNVGGQVGYAGFTFGARYYDNNKVIASNADTTHWDVGLTYAVTDAITIGTTYGRSHYDVNTGRDFKDTLWTVGATYTVAPGLALQGDIGFFDAETARSGAGNDGTVAALRAMMKF